MNFTHARTLQMRYLSFEFLANHANVLTFSHKFCLCLYISDVRIIEIDIEIVIFRKIERNLYCDFFGNNSDLIAIPYRPRVTGDQRRRSHNGLSQNGFYTPASLITLSAQEFISVTLNIGTKKLNQNRIIYKNQN